MSDEELGFVNAFIGFCTPSAETWPTTFVDGHYRVTGVEHQVVVTVNGEIRSPTPELISTSDVKQHCVILEAKSGSVNDRQARAYGVISARHLVNQSLATVKIDASQAVMDVLYICTEDNHER